MARKPRTSKSRDMRNTYYVFCEGKSEKAYIEFLRQTLRPSIQLLPIVCKSNITDKVIESNLSYRERHTTDRVFVMYDLDVAGMYERISSIKNATFLLSNPCFELWYLLHYTEHNKCIGSDECINKLKLYVKGYKKGVINADLYNVLLDAMDTASKRACKLQAPYNPSTSLWLLIDLLKSL